MPRRNSPQGRTSGFDLLRDRMPRAIAARLARAGLIGAAAAARPPEPPHAATAADERRDDAPGTSSDDPGR